MEYDEETYPPNDKALVRAVAPAVLDVGGDCIYGDAPEESVFAEKKTALEATYAAMKLRALIP